MGDGGFKVVILNSKGYIIAGSLLCILSQYFTGIAMQFLRQHCNPMKSINELQLNV